MANTELIVVECVGNPEFYDVNDVRIDRPDSVYTIEELPGKTLEVNIKMGELKCCLDFDTSDLTNDDMSDFVVALQNDTTHTLHFNPGSNQEASIRTEKGETRFNFYGAGGNNPVDFTITVPNKYCVTAFQKLLPRS